MLKELCHRTIIVAVIAVWSMAAGSFLLYHHTDDKLTQIEFQAEADIQVYQELLFTFMEYCTRLDINPKACFQGWAARGG